MNSKTIKVHKLTPIKRNCYEYSKRSSQANNISGVTLTVDKLEKAESVKSKHRFRNILY